MVTEFRPDRPLVLFRRDPSLADIEAAIAEIEQHEAAILAIEDQISLQIPLSRIEALRQEQITHRERIDTCKRVTALARRMPEELLIMIFQYRYDGSRLPPSLSQVCAAWYIAASAPQFWSSIEVNCTGADAMERAHYWLFKVGGAPMDVAFYSKSGAGINMPQNIIALFLPRATQWRRLAFRWLPREDVHSFFKLCGSTVLEHLLHISIYNDDNKRCDDYRLRDVLREDNAPCLACIAYSDCGLPSIMPMFPSHIKRLDLYLSPPSQSLSADHHIAILSNLAQSEMLSLQCRHRLLSSTTPRTSISLPALTFLNLHGLDDIDGLLQYFAVPSLRDLRVKHISNRGAWALSATDTSLFTMLSNPSPPLEFLELSGHKLRPETLITYLYTLKQLHELRLRCLEIDDATLSVLKRCEGLCPRLSRLKISLCQNIRGSTLVEVIRSRNNVNGAEHMEGRAHGGSSTGWSRIQEVSLACCPRVEEKDYKDMASMVVVHRDSVILDDDSTWREWFN